MLYIGKEYENILQSYLTCFTTCGSLCLLKPLLPTLREGNSHRYYDKIRGCISTFIASLDISYKSTKLKLESPVNSIHNTITNNSGTNIQLLTMNQTLNFCSDIILDTYQSVIIKDFFQDLLIKVLGLISSDNIVELFIRPSDNINVKCKSQDVLIKKLMSVISIPIIPKSSPSPDEIDSLLYAQYFVYNVLKIGYDM